MVIVGAFLSTLFPLIGPAVAQLPATSQTVLLLVEAFAVSVFAVTLVVKLKLSTAALLRPEMPSFAVQGIFTSVACHTPSAESQETEGADLSILMMRVCSASSFPAPS